MSNRKSGGRGIMSMANAIVLAGLVCLIALFVALGRWWFAIVMAVAALGLVGSAVYARRSSRAGDLTRVNSLEYSDERDRAIATFGLAVVGAVALIAAFAWFIVVVVTAPEGSPASLWAAGAVVGLSVTWIIGNWVGARRV